MLHTNSTISIQRGRNADVVDYTLTTPGSDKPLMKCARYYGFRNIQNLVRKLKPPKQSKLPGAVRRTANACRGNRVRLRRSDGCVLGGCTNGGGQIKVEDVVDVLPQTRGEVVEKVTPQGQKEWLRRVDEAYYSADDSDEIGDEDVDHDKWWRR